MLAPFDTDVGKAQYATAKPQIEETLGYHFTNDSLLQEALLAYPANVLYNHWVPEGNRRLAMVGDAILNVLLTDASHKEGLSTGETNDCQRLLKGDGRLARVGRFRGIDGFIIASPNPNGVSEFMVATAVEAICGAVFYDCRKTWDVVERAMDSVGVFKSERELDQS